jgi:hypothetical protein
MHSSIEPTEHGEHAVLLLSGTIAPIQRDP